MLIHEMLFQDPVSATDSWVLQTDQQTWNRNAKEIIGLLTAGHGLRIVGALTLGFLSMHWCSCLLIAESPVIYCLYVSGGDSGDVAINNMSHLWTHRSFLLVSSRERFMSKSSKGLTNHKF